MRKSSVAPMAGAFVLLMAAPALAHVTVQPPEAPTGSFFAFAVRVPNERPDASTTKVEVQFPETVTNVSVQPHPGWDYEVKMKTLDEPIEVFGEEVTEAVDTITWSANRQETRSTPTRVRNSTDSVSLLNLPAYSSGTRS